MSPLVGRLSGSSGRAPTPDSRFVQNQESPGAPQAFCPECDPFVEGLLPCSDVFIQHLDTLRFNSSGKVIKCFSYFGLKVQNLHLLSLKQREAHPAMFPTLMPFVVYRLCPEYFVFSSIEQAVFKKNSFFLIVIFKVYEMTAQ